MMRSSHHQYFQYCMWSFFGNKLCTRKYLLLNNLLISLWYLNHKHQARNALSILHNGTRGERFYFHLSPPIGSRWLIVIHTDVATKIIPARFVSINQLPVHILLLSSEFDQPNVKSLKYLFSKIGSFTIPR